jgi:hypothetical protein
MKRVSIAIAFAAVCAMPFASFAQSSGDKAAAEVLFNEGKKLLADKQYDAACTKLAESNRLDPGIGTMLHLASCYEKQGKTASAWGQFREAEQIARKEGDKRVDVAKKYADALEPKLSKMTIYVTASADMPGLEIKRDGVPVGKGQWGTPVPVDPGSHTITASAPKKKSWETKSQVPEERGLVTVTVPTLHDEPQSAPAPTTTGTGDTPPAPTGTTASTAPSDGAILGPAPGGETPKPKSPQKLIGIGVIALGVVGMGIGSFFGFRAGSLKDESGCDGNRCADETQANKLRDAASAGNVSTALFIVGGALTVGGIVLFATAPKDGPRAALRVGPGSVTLGGSF